MARPDLSDQLIHFTQGATPEAAYERLCEILASERLIGSDHLISGRYRCVCFTEAPLAALTEGLLSTWDYSRYAPFGLIFDKRYLFARGARPVIYQPAAEFDALRETHRWRHMTYGRVGDRFVDFTWEREWRLKTDALPFDPSYAGLVVPDAGWRNRMLADHNLDQDWRVLAYSQIMESSLAEQLRDPFPWALTSLRDD